MQSSDDNTKSKTELVGGLWRRALNILVGAFLIILLVVVFASPDLREGLIEQLSFHNLDDIKFIENVSYGKGKNSSKVGDLYIPKNDTRDKTSSYPAVIVIHGGSWCQGKRDDPFEEGASIYLARHGFVAFSIDYPLVGSGGGFPKDILSVKEATKYLVDNAKEYNIDKTKLFLLGYSSGAHLAMMAAYTKGNELFSTSSSGSDDAPIVAIACFAAPSNLELDDSESIDNYLKDYSGKSGSALEKLASPINYVNSAVPTILLHGTEDKNVPYKLSLEMAKKFSVCGIENKLVSVEGGSHWIGPATRAETMKQVLEFFKSKYRRVK